MTVLGTSRRASFVSSAPSRRTRARLRNGPLPKRLELLLAEPVEVLVRRELLRRGQGHLDAVEVGFDARPSPGRSRRRPSPRSARECGRSRRSRRTRCRCARRARPEASAARTASQIASTWSGSVIADRSASADSRPGSVSAVTSWPSARNAAATSSHAHAPSQNPGTRTIGAEAIRDPSPQGGRRPSCSPGARRGGRRARVQGAPGRVRRGGTTAGRRAHACLIPPAFDDPSRHQPGLDDRPAEERAREHGALREPLGLDEARKRSGVHLNTPAREPCPVSGAREREPRVPRGRARVPPARTPPIPATETTLTTWRSPLAVRDRNARHAPDARRDSSCAVTASIRPARAREEGATPAGCRRCSRAVGCAGARSRTAAAARSTCS